MIVSASIIGFTVLRFTYAIFGHRLRLHYFHCRRFMLSSLCENSAGILFLRYLAPPNYRQPLMISFIRIS